MRSLQSDGNALRILALDGGDVRCLSQLLMLKVIMHRLEYDYGNPIRPCEYFHSITGVGASGVIAVSLGVLGMTVEKAMEVFTTICEDVFAPNVRDEVSRSDKLTGAIQKILDERNLPRDTRMRGDIDLAAGCHVSICYSSADHYSCRMFRSYESRHASYNPTIIEAIRACWANVGLFSSIRVGPPLHQEELISAVNGFNNPSLEAAREAQDSFENTRSFSVFLSLGSGDRDPISISSDGFLQRTVRQTESVEESIERFLLGTSYFRFSPPNTVEDNSLAIGRQTALITTYTQAYLERDATSRRVDNYLKLSTAAHPSDNVRSIGRESEVADLVKALIAKPRVSAIVFGDDGSSKSSVAIQVLRNLKIFGRFKGRRYFVSCTMTSTAAELLAVVSSVLRPADSLPVEEPILLKFLADSPTFLILDGLENALGNDRDAVEGFLQQLSQRATILTTICGDITPRRVDWDLQLVIRPTSPRPRGDETTNFKVEHDPSDFFTGGDELLASIHAVFRHWEAMGLPHAQAVTGLGGIGKTRVAVEYAHRFKDSYSLVHWIVADSQVDLEAGYISLANILHLKEAEKGSQKDIVAAVLKWLSENTGWLLILDNVENVSLLSDNLPKPMGGHLLITTRQEQADSFFRDVRVPCMDADTGALFLLRRSRLISVDSTLASATPDDITIAKALVTAMGGLPLAMDQAGGYIASSCISLAEYQEQYDQTRGDLLRDRGQADDQSSKLHTEPVFTTFALGFQNIVKTNPNAAKLLEFCSFIHPDAIPKAMLTVGASCVDPGLRGVLTITSEWSNAIQLIRQYSLMSLSSSRETLTIHRLVQEILQFSMSLPATVELVTSAVKVVDTAFPFVNYGTLPSARLYLPHAEVCAENIKNYSLVFPEAAHLLYYLGSYFYYLGQYSQAEPHYKASLQVLDKIKSTANDVRKLSASAIRALAQNYWRVGRYKESNPFYQQALDITEAACGPNDRETALTLHLFARVLGEQGIYERCNALFERALLIWHNSNEPDREKMYARSEHEFARLLGLQGFHERAEALSSHALTVFEKPEVAGPTHPTTASILRALVHIQMDYGRYDQAEEKLDSILRIMEEQLGKNHIEAGTSCHELALLYHTEGRYDEAESYYLRALDIYKDALEEYDKKSPSPGHPDTVATLSALACLYETVGRDDKARQMYQRALAICLDQLTPQHVGAIAVRKNHSALLQRIGKE